MNVRPRMTLGRFACCMVAAMLPTGILAEPTVQVLSGRMPARQALPYDPAGPHVLEFADGSVLHGTVAGISGATITVRRSDASAPLAFPDKTIRRIILDHEPDPDAPALHATVQFVSGDWMVADVIAIRDSRADLRLASGQRLSVDRSQLDWIYLAEGSAPDVFQGPDSLDGWTSNGSWAFKNGALQCTQMGNIGRSFQVMPEQMDLEFEMARGEVQRNFMVSLNFSASGPAPERQKNVNRNAWAQVRFNEGQLYIYCANGNQNVNHSVEISKAVQEAGGKGVARYRILFDRCRAGRLAVFINDRKVADQKVPQMPAGVWNGTMYFQPMRWSTDADWTISKIRLSPWDGQLPRESGRPAPDRMDGLSLYSGESRAGRLEVLLGGAIKFRSSAGVEDIPRSEVRMLRFRRPENPLPPADPATPRLVLAQRGLWRAKEVKLNEGVLSLSTSFAGELNLKAAEVFSLLFSQPDSGPEAPPSDRLVFRNGDQLRGKLTSLNKPDSLGWSFAEAQAVDFQTRRLGGVLLAKRGEGKSTVADVVVRFRSGDWLGGVFSSLDDSSVKFHASFGREISVTRSSVQSIYFGAAAAPPVWEGAMDPEGWWKGQMGPNTSWFGYSSGGQGLTLPKSKVYLDGAYALPGTGGQSGVGRRMESLPDRVELNFDVSCESMAPTFYAQLFYEKKQPDGLMMQGWQGGMYLYDMQNNAKRRGFFNGQPQQVQYGDKVDSNAKRHRFRILADRKARKAVFFVDGVQVCQHARRGGEADGESWGDGFSLHPQGGSNATVVFSNIWVAPWNGQLPNALTTGDGQRVSLANGDEALCVVESGSPTELQVEFEGEQLNLPRQRVLSVDFGASPSPAPTSTSESPPPRMRLEKGGSFHTEDLKIANDTVTCRHGSLGEISLPLAAFSEIVWHSLDEDIRLGQAQPPKRTRRPVDPVGQEKK